MKSNTTTISAFEGGKAYDGVSALVAHDARKERMGIYPITKRRLVYADSRTATRAVASLLLRFVFSCSSIF